MPKIGIQAHTVAVIAARVTVAKTTAVRATAASARAAVRVVPVRGVPLSTAARAVQEEVALKQQRVFPAIHVDV